MSNKRNQRPVGGGFPATHSKPNPLLDKPAEIAQPKEKEKPKAEAKP